MQLTPQELVTFIHSNIFPASTEAIYGSLLDRVMQILAASVDIRALNDYGTIFIKGDETTDGSVRLSVINGRVEMETLVLGVWQENLVVGLNDVKSSLVFSAQSASPVQAPAVVDSPIQIEFGPAQNSPLDDAMIDALGNVTINKAGVYIVNVFGHFGRLGAGGEAELRFRALVDGAQVGETIGAKIDSSKAIDYIGQSLTIFLDAGIVLSFELYRDSSGMNTGGLYSQSISIAGWNPCPSAGITIRKLIKGPI